MTRLLVASSVGLCLVAALKAYTQALSLSDPASSRLVSTSSTSCQPVDAWKQEVNDDYWSGSIGVFQSQKIKNTSPTDITICKVDFWIYNNAGSTADVYVKARSGKATDGSDYGGPSQTNAVPSTTNQWYSFEFTEANRPVIPAGTDFWIGYYTTQAHHSRIKYDTSAPIGQGYEDSTYGFWQGNTEHPDSDMVFRIYTMQ